MQLALPCNDSQLKDWNCLFFLTVTGKVALLIANEQYSVREFDNLYTPCNDVQALSEVLTTLGFKVIALHNLTKIEMKNALQTFSDLLEKGSYGWYIPVDFYNICFPFLFDCQTSGICMILHYTQFWYCKWFILKYFLCIIKVKQWNYKMINIIVVDCCAIHSYYSHSVFCRQLFYY